MKMPKKKNNYAYLNQSQANAEIYDCKFQYHELGRGDGKSFGIQSRKIERRALELPRSTGLFVTDTYKQFWTRVYPSLAKGLERLGFKRDVNFWIGQRPPRKVIVNLPYEVPADLQHFMFFYSKEQSATGMHIGSLERHGNIDGLNTDWILGDESKMWNPDRYKQGAVPTMRGNEEHFRNHYLHQSICLTTSPATAVDSHWFEEFEKHHSQAFEKAISALMYYILKWQSQLEDPLFVDRKKPHIQKKLTQFINKANKLREYGTYYQRSGSFANIHVLTPKYIQTQRKILNDSDFAALILGLRQKRIRNGFYAHLSISRHTYKDKGDLSHLHSINFDPEKLSNPDCRFDSDINASKPLEIAVDFNIKISSLAIGQYYTWGYRFLNHVYIEHPKFIKDLAERFNEYYKYHPNKDLIYVWYLSENKRNLDDKLKDAEKFANYLDKLGWNIKQVRKGMPPSHHKRYDMMQELLKPNNGSIQADRPRIEFNYYNCYDMINAMLLTPVKQVGNKIEKNKKSERTEELPPQHTTNVTDPVDTLLSHHFLSHAKGRIGYMPPQSV